MAALAPADLASAEGARAWAGAAVAEFGGVDILYNNASALRSGPLMELSDEDWHFTIKNELDIVWFSVRAARPASGARRRVHHQRRLISFASRGAAAATASARQRGHPGPWRGHR